MPHRQPNAERLILIANARSARVGGWGAALVLAAISVAEHRRFTPTLKWLAAQTGLKVTMLHNLLRELVQRGLVEAIRARGKIVRRLTAPGRKEIRGLCGADFVVRKAANGRGA